METEKTEVTEMIDPTQVFKTLDQVIMEYSMFVLDALGGHQTKTAETLGINRKTLWRYINRTKTPEVL